MEVVDLIKVRDTQRKLLDAACKLFHDAQSVWTPRDADDVAEIRDGDGNVIAYGWIDSDGKPEFKPWRSSNAN